MRSAGWQLSLAAAAALLAAVPWVGGCSDGVPGREQHTYGEGCPAGGGSSAAPGGCGADAGPHGGGWCESIIAVPGPGGAASDVDADGEETLAEAEGSPQFQVTVLRNCDDDASGPHLEYAAFEAGKMAGAAASGGSAADGLPFFEEDTGAPFDVPMIDGLAGPGCSLSPLPEGTFGEVDEVGVSHNPGDCYGACGAGCDGCCRQIKTECPPLEWVLNGGWPATAAAPSRCDPAPNQGGLHGDYQLRVHCGLSELGYRNNGLGPRGTFQSNQSPGMCPATDWSNLHYFMNLMWDGAMVRRDWIDYATDVKACSVHAGCYEHDECNRHDAWVTFAFPNPQAWCQGYGTGRVGLAAAWGTPTVPFNVGYWSSGGSYPLAGTGAGGFAYMGRDVPKRACVYQVKRTTDGWMARTDKAAFAYDYLTDHVNQVQVGCPYHNNNKHVGDSTTAKPEQPDGAKHQPRLEHRDVGPELELGIRETGDSRRE